MPLSPRRIDLRVVFYFEDDLWFAHCLEMDLLGHGGSRRAAFDMLCDAILAQIEESVALNNPDNIFQAAERRIWNMYAEAKDAPGIRGEIAVREATRVGSLHVESMNVREYHEAGVLATC